MSDPSGISTVNHNDDQDDSTVRNSSTKNTGHGNFPFHNSRITSPHILKMEQNHETKLANNRAYDEVHEVESKHSHVKKFVIELNTAMFLSFGKLKLVCLIIFR